MGFRFVDGSSGPYALLTAHEPTSEEPVPASKAHLLAAGIVIACGLSHASHLSAHPASLALPIALDEGDEEAQFIAGIAKRGLHDMVVREARDFLQRRASHGRAATVRYRLADALYELGRPAEALTEYRTLDRVNGFEQASEVKFRLGQCLLDTGKPSEAAEAFRAAVQGKADYLKVPAAYLMGEALFQAADYPAAKAAYNAVLGAGEAGAEYARDARYGVAWSAWKGGDLEGTVTAAEAFLKAHASDPQAGELAFLAAEAHLASDRPEDALRWYDRVKDGDRRGAAMRGGAFAEAARGNHADAARRFRAYLDAYPQGEFAAEAALQEGVQLVSAKRYPEAVAAFTAKGAPVDAQWRYWQAMAHAGADQHEAALAAAQDGLRRRPDEALAGRLRVAAGDALFELGRADEAARLYETSGSAYALHAAAVARLNAGDAKEAARLAETLLAGPCREPGSAYRSDALLTRAEALFRLERYKECEPLLLTLKAEAKPGRNGAPATTPAGPDVIARADSRLAWCRWYAGEAEQAKELFSALARNDAASVAERQEAAFMAGRAALESGDEAGARNWFDAYLRAAPKGTFAAEATLRLARLTEGEQGAALFARLAEQFPDSDLAAAGLSELAERRIAAGDTAGAAEAYGALLQRFPDDDLAPSAAYGLGWARYQLKQYPEAAAALWSVASAAEGDPRLRTASFELLVWVEAGAERPAEAVRAFDGLAAAIDDDARILAAARAADGALAKAGDTPRRKVLWNRVTAKVKGAAERSAAQVEGAFLALDTGDVKSAMALATAARAINAKSPQVAELHFFIGEAYFAAEDDAKAAPCYAVASVNGAPQVAERALYKAGFSLLRSGDNEEATAAFASLVERFPAGALAPESMFLAGEARYRDGDDEKAAEWLRRMLKAAPKHASRPKALFRLGVAEGRLENWRGSADALTELVAKSPDFPSVVEAELWRGRSLSRLDERRAARQSLSRVVEKDKGVLSAQARIELGRLSEKENDDEAAISEYLKVAVLYGHADECSEALVRAGDVLKRTGEPERARAQYEEAVKDYPKTAWAAEARKRLGSQR